MEQRVVRLLY